MPMHDWTRVEPGLFHDFHSTWLVELKRELQRTLPSNYYALVEQVAGGYGPDVLTLEVPEWGLSDTPSSGGVAVVDAPPKVQFEFQSEIDLYAAKAKHLSIRHVSTNKVVAVVEIISPGNKGSEYALDSFVEKVVSFLRGGIHLLIIDPHPPGPRDPEGLHPLIWDKIGDKPFAMPKGKNRLLAAYQAGITMRAYLNTLGVGDPLTEMPLFLKPGYYLPVNLEAPYLRAYELVPPHYRRILEAT